MKYDEPEQQQITFKFLVSATVDVKIHMKSNKMYTPLPKPPLPKLFEREPITKNKWKNNCLYL